MKDELILIVEDSPTQAEKLRYILEQNNYKVMVAFDGMEALENLQNNKPSIIISDIIMPGMNGFELCQKIKQNPTTNNIPVILLTSLSNSEDVLEGLACGADNFLTKPYNIEYLLAHVGRILANKKLGQSEKMKVGIEIQIGGEKRFIDADHQQMFTLLISTYEAAVQRNIELAQSQQELNTLNEKLENLVEERTAELSSEINARISAQEELKNSFSLLEATFESAVDGILVVDLHGKIQKYNRKFTELWRIPESIMETRMDDDALNYIVGQLKHPDHFLNKVKDLNKNKMAESFDVLEFLDGRIFERYSQPQLMDQKVVGRVWSFWDVTNTKKAERALRESEAKFRVIFDQSPVGSVIVGLDKKFTKSNLAFCNLLGYTEGELIGKSISDITHPEDLEIGMLEMKQLMEGKMETCKVQKRYLRKDGGIVWGETSICLVKDTFDKPLYFLPVIQDISERIKHEAEIIEKNNQLEKSNSEKDKFFSIIAHDLKSPFNTIIGFSDLLVEMVNEKDYDGIDRYAGIIKKSSESAMDLLMNLMDWSRSQTGRLEFKPCKFKIADLIHEITPLFINIASQKSITVKKNLPLNAQVIADKDMISTILRNLISNAIKFTYPGGEIIISAESYNNELTISVTDNGVGISVTAIEKIFRLSENFSTSGTQKEQGTGLGLILCKEFIERHQGKIWVESQEGKGSSFYFTIPSQTTP